MVISLSATTDTTQEAPPQRQLLELNGVLDPGGHQDATMLVRWCTPRDEALADLLKQQGITKPYVLLTVRPYSERFGVREYAGESERKLVKLTDQEATIRFSRPGLNEVTACIVGNQEGKGRLEIGSVFLAGKPYEFTVDIFGYSYRELLPGYKSNKPNRYRYQGYIVPDTADSVSVDIPKEFFADYPQWAKTWVGKFFGSKGADSCGMRRRIIASFFISLLYFPLGYAARVIQLVGGLWFGLRGLQVRSFLHPIQYDVMDVIDDTTTSFWFKDKFRRPRHLLLLPLNPVTPVISGLVFWGIGTFHVTRGGQVVGLIGWEWWQYFLLTALAHLAVLALALVVVVLLGLASAIIGTSLSNKLSRWFSEWRRAHRSQKSLEKAAEAERRKAARVQALEQALKGMACTAATRKVSLDALPKKKHTLLLRAQVAKGKVCKPLPR